MRAQITDLAALQGLSPMNITSYLQNRGGKRKGHFRDVAGVWELAENEIIVPNDRQLVDYASSISTILSKLEKIENRSQLEILKDIQLSEYDVVRIRNTSEKAIKGSMPYSDIVEIITHTKDIFLSVASSLLKRTLRFTSRKPPLAEE